MKKFITLIVLLCLCFSLPMSSAAVAQENEAKTIQKECLTREYRLSNDDICRSIFPLLTVHNYDEFGVETGQETFVDFSGIPWQVYQSPNTIYSITRNADGEISKIENLYNAQGSNGVYHTIYEVEDGHVKRIYDYYPESGQDTRETDFTVFNYDSAGRCTASRMERRTEDSVVTEERSYDKNGCITLCRVQSKSFWEPDFSRISQGVYTYDDQGNMLSLEETEGRLLNPGTTEEVYEAGRVRIGTFSYDEHGNETGAETTDFEGKSVRASFAYDEQDNLVSASWEEDGLQRAAEYLYDENNHLVELRRFVNGSQQDTTGFTYTLMQEHLKTNWQVEIHGDGLELPYGVTLFGVWEKRTASDGRLQQERSYRIRPYGELFRINPVGYTRGPGTEVNFFEEPGVFYIYETLDCLSSADGSSSSSPYTSAEELLPNLRESYGGYPIPPAEEGWRLKTAWNESVGDLMSYARIRTDISYDDSGYPSFRSLWDSADKSRFGTSAPSIPYDGNGLPQELVIQMNGDYACRLRFSEDGSLCAYGSWRIAEGNAPTRESVYNLRGQLVESHGLDENGEKTNVTSYVYDDDGTLVRKTTRNLDGSETEWTIEYNDAGRVLLVAKPDWVSDAYEYDGDGNIVRCTVANGRTDTQYTYDEDGMLTSAVYNNGSRSENDYRYDVDDNGWLRAVRAGERSVRLAFDEHGNLTRYFVDNGNNHAYYTYEWEPY